MHIQSLRLSQATGHLLLHNVLDANGRRILRKGVRLDAEHLRKLQALGWEEVEVAVLASGDVWEEEAATQLAGALQHDLLDVAWGVGGRANFHTSVAGVFVVDGVALRAINSLPGIALATLPQFAVVHPRFSGDAHPHGHGDQVATLKIIPYAIPETALRQALEIASGTALLAIRPLHSYRVALLIIGEAAAQRRLQSQFEAPIRNRVEALNSTIDEVAFTLQDESHIAATVVDLLSRHDALIIAGQTSIMDIDDLTLRALRKSGITDLTHGAPVDPGNLIALGYAGEKPVLCAPGCARSPKRNVVDLVLPRLFTGERMGQAELIEMAVGGLLL